MKDFEDKFSPHCNSGHRDDLCNADAHQTRVGHGLRPASSSRTVSRQLLAVRAGADYLLAQQQLPPTWPCPSAGPVALLALREERARKTDFTGSAVFAFWREIRAIIFDIATKRNCTQLDWTKPFTFILYGPPVQRTCDVSAAHTHDAVRR